MTTVLFDSGSNFSYVSVQFALGFELVWDVLDSPIHVSNHIGEFVIVTHAYRACFIFYVILDSGRSGYFGHD